MEDKNLSSPELYRIQGQLSHLLDSKATAKHQHEHGPISQIRDAIKECSDLIVLQVSGQWLGEAQRDPGDRVDYGPALLIDEIIEEETNRLQMTGDRLRRASLSEKMIDISSDLLSGNL